MNRRFNWKALASVGLGIALFSGGLSGCGPGATSKEVKVETAPPQGPSGGGEKGGSAAPGGAEGGSSAPGGAAPSGAGR